jgi:hypothetical protein
MGARESDERAFAGALFEPLFSVPRAVPPPANLEQNHVIGSLSLAILHRAVIAFPFRYGGSTLKTVCPYKEWLPPMTPPCPKSPQKAKGVRGDGTPKPNVQGADDRRTGKARKTPPHRRAMRRRMGAHLYRRRRPGRWGHPSGLREGRDGGVSRHCDATRRAPRIIRDG